MRVLVTGGAGYIGSHFVRVLLQNNHVPVVVDDLSSGHRSALPADVDIREGSIEDAAFVHDTIVDYDIDAVAHFAARIQVAESVRDPARYYEGNIGAAMTLLEGMMSAGVRTIVATSSAAVYGERKAVIGSDRVTFPPCDERDDVLPDNPYGDTKLAVERMLAAYGRAYGLRHASMRCFNVAGAHHGLAERHAPETHLIPLVLAAAASEEGRFTVYGDDYPTLDGTAVRDYVDVHDVAHGHLSALVHLMEGGEGGVFNLGSGVGYSVREVVGACRRVAGRPIRVDVGPRRPGDSPVLVAGTQRAKDKLGWYPYHSQLDEVVRRTWESRGLGGRGD